MPTNGKRVTAADFRGKVVLLYFGYTLCPDFCPTTLAKHCATCCTSSVRRPTASAYCSSPSIPIEISLATLKHYAALFAPQVVGLRGTPDQLADLARRYRVAYSVTPASNGHPYEVTHSSIVYVFDEAGQARLAGRVDGHRRSRYRRRDRRSEAAYRARQPAGAVATDHADDRLAGDGGDGPGRPIA